MGIYNIVDDSLNIPTRTYAGIMIVSCEAELFRWEKGKDGHALRTTKRNPKKYIYKLKNW